VREPGPAGTFPSRAASQSWCVVSVAVQPESVVAVETEADLALVARAVAGDGGAFRSLVERHQGKIVALLHRLCGCPEQALDLAQETFLSAFRHLGSFRHDSRFSTWLHAIAVNQARSAARRRRPVASLGALAPDGRPQIPEPTAAGPAVSAGLEQEELACRIAAALARLDDRYREVVVLADMHESSYEEIAAALDIPLGTVRSRLHRGRTELRAILASR
jgi:RNA polymerase sigma-70 factor (ECF subfamily)